MQGLENLFLAVHILGSVYWIAAGIFVVFVFHPIYRKYDHYLFFNNFRVELMQLLLRSLNIALFTALLSGMALIGVVQRNVLVGTYGLLFSGKMALLIFSFYLMQPYLKIMNLAEKSSETDANAPPPRVFNTRSILLLLSALAVIYLGVFLRNAVF